MIYLYACKACGGTVELQRPIAERDDCPPCCGTAMVRRFVMPTINTNRWCYDDFPTGTSMKDRVEAAKKADKDYEARWGGHVPNSKPPSEDSGPSLAQIGKEMGVCLD